MRLIMVRFDPFSCRKANSCVVASLYGSSTPQRDPEAGRPSLSSSTSGRSTNNPMVNLSSAGRITNDLDAIHVRYVFFSFSLLDYRVSSSLPL
jgi:hypothetical protein